MKLKNQTNIKYIRYGKYAMILGLLFVIVGSSIAQNGISSINHCHANSTIPKAGPIPAGYLSYSAFATNFTVEKGIWIAGNINTTQMNDNMGMEFTAAGEHSWFSYNQRVKVTFTFNQVQNVSTLKYAMRVVESLHDIQTSTGFSYLLTAQNATGGIVYTTHICESGLESLGQSVITNFNRSIMIASVTMEFSKGYWFWDDHYVLKADIDYLELVALKPNQAPIIPSQPVLVPMTPTLDSDLSCILSESPYDPDGNETPIITYYQWENSHENSITEIFGEYESTLTLDTTRFLVGDLIRIKLVVADSLGALSCKYSNWVTIQDRVSSLSYPKITSNETSNDAAYVTSILCASALATDPDPNQLLGLQYCWYRNTIQISDWLDSGILELTTENVSVEDVFTCEIRSTSMDLCSNIVVIGGMVNVSIEIQNRLPYITNITLSPVNPSESDTLVVIHDTPQDADNNDLVINYTWNRLRNGVWTIVQTGIIPILDSSFTQTNDSFFVEIQVSDGFGSVNYTSFPVSILTTPPKITNISLESYSADETPLALTKPQHQDHLFKLNIIVQDSDIGQTISINIRWILDDQILTEEIVSVTDGIANAWLNGTDIRGILYAELIAFDGYGYSTVNATNVITIVNDLPYVSALNWNTATVVSSNHLVCNPMVIDLEDDVCGVEFKYYINDQFIPWAISNILPNIALVHGDKIQIFTRTYDMYGSQYNYDAWHSWSAIYVENILPEILDAYIVQDDNSGDNLSLVITALDLDNDQINYQYQWLINNATLLGETKAFLARSKVSKGNSIQCQIWVSDTYDNIPGFAYTTPIFTIKNTTPIVMNITVPQILYANEDLFVSIEGTDNDHDDLTYEFTFYRNNEIIQQSTNATLASALCLAYSDVWVSVRVYDGLNWSETAVSTKVFIHPSPRDTLFDWDRILLLPNISFIILGGIFVMTLSMGRIIQKRLIQRRPNFK